MMSSLWLSTSVRAMSIGQLQAIVDGDLVTMWSVPETGVYLEKSIYTMQL